LPVDDVPRITISACGSPAAGAQRWIAQPTASGSSAASSTRTTLPDPPLLVIARERKWLDVDAQPTCR
jgi:hypothetical protein